MEGGLDGLRGWGILRTDDMRDGQVSDLGFLYLPLILSYIPSNLSAPHAQ